MDTKARHYDASGGPSVTRRQPATRPLLPVKADLRCPENTESKMSLFTDVRVRWITPRLA